MRDGSPPRILLAGTGSGVGKTSVAVGLAHALSRKGLRVQTFKVGPDFLDPTYLALASGRPCYNLDGWMSGEAYVKVLFDKASQDADVALIEGVMGLFDGADPGRLDGSSAEVARWLEASVLLVVNVHGVSGSLAATVKGFSIFDPLVRVMGVIANQVGSDHHASILSQALQMAALPPLVGAIPRGAFPELKHRHLGLLSATPNVLSPEVLTQLADVCEKHVDMETVLAGQTPPLPHPLLPKEVRGSSSTRPVRLGVAMDEAFHFYYQDAFDALREAGCEVIFFSPIHDRTVPEGLDGLYLGGGYPETMARELSGNESMRESVRAFAESGKALYAECGGLMYLSQSVITLQGDAYPMAGILPVNTRMCARRRALRYAEVRLTRDALWGRAGDLCRGHEFHYSELVEDWPWDSRWERVYALKHRKDEEIAYEGFQRGRVLSSYVHLHLAGRPEAVSRFVSGLKE